MSEICCRQMGFLGRAFADKKYWPILEMGVASNLRWSLRHFSASALLAAGSGSGDVVQHCKNYLFRCCQSSVRQASGRACATFARHEVLLDATKELRPEVTPQWLAHQIPSTPSIFGHSRGHQDTWYLTLTTGSLAAQYEEHLSASAAHAIVPSVQLLNPGIATQTR